MDAASISRIKQNAVYALMKGAGKIAIMGSIGMIDVDGVEERPSNPKQGKRRLLIIAMVVVMAIILIAATLLWPPIHPTAEVIIRSDGLNLSSPLGTSGWVQTAPVTTMIYDPNSPGPAFVERSSSAMWFESSTVNMSLMIQITEFASSEKAKEYFASQMQEAHSHSNITVIDMSNGKGYFMIYPGPLEDGAALFHAATFYNDGRMVGTAYLPGDDLTAEDHSLISAIAELQLERI